MNISKINPIMTNKIQYNSGIGTKNKEIETPNTNTTLLPSLSGTRCIANISFKSTDWPKLHEAIFWNRKEEFDELLLNPDTNVNELNEWGEPALMRTCQPNSDDSKLYYFKQLLRRRDLDPNYCPRFSKNYCPVTALAYVSNNENIVWQYYNELLKLPNVDKNKYYEYKKTNGDFPNWPSINRMIDDYGQGKDKRTDIIVFKPKIEKILSLKDVWTPEEEKQIEKFIKDNNYEKLASLFVRKGIALDKELKKIPKLKAATIKSVRESVTAQIHNEEKTKIENAYATRNAALNKKEADLHIKQAEIESTQDKANKDKAEYEAALKRQLTLEADTIKEIRAKETEKIRQEEKDALEAQKKEAQNAANTYDNLISDFKVLVSEEVAHERGGFRAFYGIKADKLPENMNLEDQTVWVLNVLVSRQNKLTERDKDFPMRITKTIQDNSGNISLDGLNFLERIIDASKEKCSEKDLIAAIKSVKGNYGQFDMKKAAYFISNLAWGDNTINSVIKQVKTYGMKV